MIVLLIAALMFLNFDYKNPVMETSDLPLVITQAKVIAFLVYGAKKAEAVRHVIKGDYHPEEFPAQLMKPENKQLHWFLDKDATSFL